MKKPVNVDEYITSYSNDVQNILNQVRSAVLKASPEAEESISYGMPYYKFNGRLLYFAAHTALTGFTQ